MATKSFWIGLIGGIAGICAACLALFCGSVAQSLTGSDGGLSALGLGAILFSVAGIIGGSMEKRKNIGGAIMLISGVAVLICISLFGVLTALLFVIGGLLLIKEYLDEKKVRPIAPVSAAADGGEAKLK